MYLISWDLKSLVPGLLSVISPKRRDKGAIAFCFLFPFTKITGLTDIGGKEAFDQAFGATMTSVGQGANTHEVGNAVAM